ncbi:Rieske (2Fe-2S) protein [Methanolobus profundi]|uniref:3-phenylpropionate/trans-cinnamate dioxygenase ferredoxin subunit n=1 Tax=Methanolobus profundi TaxID=487685 RepID=A0A1I4TRG7_9EURY|nr:Rieske (2Fe-2S) protein [Methanolobus profundi]SFM79308.1 3-phenylpropionate/trans-cinnamate dioxygenase ferredoxin subunit [Methanolobus profundi]
MSSWAIAADDNEVKEGKIVPVSIGDQQMILLRINGEVFALENRCPHMNCQLQGGTLQEYSIKCPCHSWTFDVRTGAYIASDKIRVNVYETQVKDGKISILT